MTTQLGSKTASGLVTAYETCGECGEKIAPEVRTAYRWLYSSGGMKHDTFERALNRAVYEGRGFEVKEVNDEAVCEAIEDIIGCTTSDLVAAVLHRRWEDGP